MLGLIELLLLLLLLLPMLVQHLVHLLLSLHPSRVRNTVEPPFR